MRLFVVKLPVKKSEKYFRSSIKSIKNYVINLVLDRLAMGTFSIKLNLNFEHTTQFKHLIHSSIALFHAIRV